MKASSPWSASPHANATFTNGLPGFSPANCLRPLHTMMIHALFLRCPCDLPTGAQFLAPYFRHGTHWHSTAHNLCAPYRSAHAGVRTAGQDARIHVSEPDYEALTHNVALHNSKLDHGITIAEFELIIRAQLTLYVQACLQPSISLRVCSEPLPRCTPGTLESAPDLSLELRTKGWSPHLFALWANLRVERAVTGGVGENVHTPTPSPAGLSCARLAGQARCAP